jgi:hypothetical protein
MSKPIKIRINLTKLKAGIIQDLIFTSEKTGDRFLNLVAFEVKDSKFGETHAIKQDTPRDWQGNDAPFLGNLTLPDESQQPSRSVDPHGRDRTGYQTPAQAATPACKQTNDGNSEIPW